MNRTTKLKMNTTMSLANRITILISGLILPRLILSNYGSEVNGLVASINQFLAIITFLDLGVGSVVQSALYRPLANKNEDEISSILTASKSYFRKIAYILVAYVTLLMLLYPMIVNQSMDYLSTLFLIFSLSLGIFAQYYFGIVNELLLNADQKSYIQLSTEIVVVVLNLLISTILISTGNSIQIVKLASGLIYLLRPIYLTYYVNKNYSFIKDVELTEDPLPQKWNGMGQHIAYTIQNSTDIVMLTMFSTLSEVSVYSVYNMVLVAIQTIIASLSTGIGSFFGDLLANNERTLLNSYFSRIEWITHTSVIYLYGMTAVLINSFVDIYTSGIEDVNYYAPIFSFLMVLAKITYSIRTPYQTLIFSAGHFKETQASSFIEASLNVVISFLLVWKFGLIGIALGTLVSMLYRTAYLINYLSKFIIQRPITIFLKYLFVDALSFIGILVIGSIVSNFITISSLVTWVFYAALLGVISLVLLVIINLIFYKELFGSIITTIKK